MYDAKNTPVLFLLFNRPDTTAQVFAAIAKARPRRLFVAADGSRPDKAGELERCQAARAIVQKVDWDCDVKTLFRDQNLGCKKAVSAAITWFFEQVEEGIILEDDCLPSDSFFPFCAELLEKHRDDTRIMMISGDNFQDGIQRGDASYYFSKIPHIWGWATWRRAWRLYDGEMKSFPAFVREKAIRKVSPDVDIQQYWLSCFISTFEGRIDSWGYRWVYAIFSRSGLSICPQVNLIQNIGFCPEATHTRDASSTMGNLSLSEMSSMTHPSVVLPNDLADDYVYDRHLNVRYHRIKNPLMRWRKILRKRWKTARQIKGFEREQQPARSCAGV